jgi:hypothetical protein
VRVYKVNDHIISDSPYQKHSFSQFDLKLNIISTDKWAFFPTTIQWGFAPGVQHLILVGFSPRSRTADDCDIPEDKRWSGEICLWDGLTGDQWILMNLL